MDDTNTYSPEQLKTINLPTKSPKDYLTPGVVFLVLLGAFAILISMQRMNYSTSTKRAVADPAVSNTDSPSEQIPSSTSPEAGALSPEIHLSETLKKDDSSNSEDVVNSILEDMDSTESDNIDTDLGSSDFSDLTLE